MDKQLIKDLNKNLDSKPEWLQKFGNKIADSLTKGSSFESAINKLKPSGKMLEDMFSVLQEGSLGKTIAESHSFDRGIFLATFCMGWITGNKHNNPFNKDETKYLQQWAISRLEDAISWDNPDKKLIEGIIKKIENL